jgi:20S proteasome subunit alpha 2
LATEKKMGSPLMDPTSVQKICHLTEGAAIVYSGMGPDFRVLVNKGRKSAQTYFRQYQV